MLTSRFFAGVSSLGLIMIATSATAQLDARKGVQDEQAVEAANEPAIIELSRLRNAEVCIGEPSSDGSELVPGAAVGKLDDLVLDRERREISHAVVKTDAGLRTVIANRMSWSEDEKKWVVSLTMTQFGQSPELDLAKLGEATSGTIEAGGKREGVAEPVAPVRHVLLADLAKSPVQAMDGVLGDMGQVLVFADGPKIAFITVKPDATAAREDAPEPASLLAIPWSLCDVEPVKNAGFPTNGGKNLQGKDTGAKASHGDEATRTEVLVQTTRERIQAAPAPQNSEGRRLSDPEFRAKLYEHYGVKPPSFEQKLKLAGGL